MTSGAAASTSSLSHSPCRSYDISAPQAPSPGPPCPELALPLARRFGGGRQVRQGTIDARIFLHAHISVIVIGGCERRQHPFTYVARLSTFSIIVVVIIGSRCSIKLELCTIVCPVILEQRSELELCVLAFLICTCTVLSYLQNSARPYTISFTLFVASRISPSKFLTVMTKMSAKICNLHNALESRLRV